MAKIKSAEFIKGLNNNDVYTIIIDGETITKKGDELRSYIITHSVQEIEVSEKEKITQNKITKPIEKEV